MAKIDLTTKAAIGVPHDEMLKFALPGKPYPSNIPGRGASVMFTLASIDPETGKNNVMFLEEDICDEPNELFRQAGVGAGVPFRLTLRSRNGQRYYELKRLSPAQPAATNGQATPFDELPTDMEAKLQASIHQVQQRKAQRVNPSEVAPAAQRQPARESSQQTEITMVAAKGHTKTSMVIASLLIANVDAIRVAEDYARSKGIDVKPLVVEFTAEDLRCLTSTLYIQGVRDTENFELAMARNAAVHNGGARQWQQ